MSRLAKLLGGLAAASLSAWAAGPEPRSESLRPEGAAGQPRIAVVIDDFGLNYPKDVPDELWMRLPWPLTFAVMPRSPHTRRAAEAVTRSGKELIVHFPFDPFLSLRLPDGGEASPEDTRKVGELLDEALQTVPGAVGLNNHRSYRATRNRALMRWFMGRYKGRGLYFLDSSVSRTTVAFEEARKAGLRAALNDAFLDGSDEPKARRRKDPAELEAARERDKKTCERSLRQAARKARRTGEAVAIGHHYFWGTYRCLEESLPELRRQGFQLVTASAIAR